MRRTLRIAVSILLLCGAGLAFLGWEGHGPLSGRYGVVTEKLSPESVLTLGTGGDPLVVSVGFAWPEEGYCPSEFRVTATETASRVILGQVQRRVPRGDTSCPGVGAGNGRAFVPLRLKTPLAARSVFRALDGKQLPVTRQP